MTRRTTDRSLTRRRLLRTAARGAALAGLPTLLGLPNGIARAATKDSGVASVYLEIGGNVAAAVQGFSGGNAFAEVLAEPLRDGVVRKVPGPVRFEDLLIDVPIGGVDGRLLKWIDELLTGVVAPRDGAIVFADATLGPLRLEFFGGVLTEVSWPVLDATSTDAANLRLRIVPRSTRTVVPATTAGAVPPVKPVGVNAFRFEPKDLTGADVVRLAGLSARRPLVVTTGADRLPQVQYGPLECAPLELLLAAATAAPYLKWFDEMVVRGIVSERTASVQLFTTTLVPAMTVDLQGVGIVRCAPAPRHRETGAALMQIGLYCETIAVA